MKTQKVCTDCTHARRVPKIVTTTLTQHTGLMRAGYACRKQHWADAIISDQYFIPQHLALTCEDFVSMDSDNE